MAGVSDRKQASVPKDADLIKVAFASGPDHLNRALIDRIAGMYPELPLYVVGEFEPEPGKFSQWIPLACVARSKTWRRVRAAIGDKRIRLAAMVLAPGVPLGKMRLIAWIMATRALVVYDEKIQIVEGSRWVTLPPRSAPRESPISQNPSMASSPGVPR